MSDHEGTTGPKPVTISGFDARNPQGMRALVISMRRPLSQADLRALVEAQDVSESVKQQLLQAAQEASRDPERQVVMDGRVLRGDEAAVEMAMARLRASERERLEAIGELKRLGAIRSKGLVADLGERLAASYYGVELAPPSTPGYDLKTPEGLRVQVKTLRSTPGNPRSSMGVLTDPYDLLLAIRLDLDYRVDRAIELPRSALEAHYPHGTRSSWTKALEFDPGARRISAYELVRGRAA